MLTFTALFSGNGRPHHVGKASAVCNQIDKSVMNPHSNEKTAAFMLTPTRQHDGNKRTSETYKETTSHLAQNGISSGLGSSLRILTGHVALICQIRFEVNSVEVLVATCRVENYGAATTKVCNHAHTGAKRFGAAAAFSRDWLLAANNGKSSNGTRWQIDTRFKLSVRTLCVFAFRTKYSEYMSTVLIN